MKTWILALFLASLVMLAACRGDGDGEPATPAATRTEPAPTAEGSPTPTGSPAVCAPNPEPGSKQTLQIDTPQPDETVDTTFTVSGRIAAFEATFQVTVFDSVRRVLTHVVGMSAEGQTLAAFSEEITLPADFSGPACIWVYELSARDGNPTNVGQIPVDVAP